LSTSKALENLNPVGAFIKDRTDYNSIYEKSSAVYPKGEYLGVFKKEFQAIALSVFEIPVMAGSANYETAKFLIRNTSFYRFVQDQKQKNAFISIAQSQVDFIKALKIEYLLVSKNARLPEKIADLVSTVITDPLSGEKCYILNPSK
ncbi:MAG TPA: hypothetical protein VK927_04080, partial [Adhaeribacter sp.]|nr:hypothetical protein [Adhaeribacter sp.]